jgi:hypothetical protein
MWLVGLLTVFTPAAAEVPSNYVAGRLIQLNDNGAWSWFTDERAIVHDGQLIVGSVRAVGHAHLRSDPNRGNVEVTVYDLASGMVRRTVLHPHFQQNDHGSPALLPLPDGRYLVAYTRHRQERRIYYRVSAPHNPLKWGRAVRFETPGRDSSAFRDNVTYSNLFRLPSGRVMNFFRGVGHDPNYAHSDDNGRTWRYGGRLLRGRGGYSPYLKYAFDGQNTIHFVATDDHPRRYHNSIYHGFIRDGHVHLSDGTRHRRLSDSTAVDIAAWDLTRVFPGDPDNVAWVIDLELDAQQRPYLLASVRKHAGGRPGGRESADHRFYYGRWNGSVWRGREIAYAGTSLAIMEEDYTGLAALDPNNPDVVYVSTDADPVTGTPLVSRADGQRHHELYRGTTRDAGTTWTWEPITANSTADNLRPIVPRWKDARTVLVWMRGRYWSAAHWTTAVVATILPPKPRGELGHVAPRDNPRRRWSRAEGSREEARGD